MLPGVRIPATGTHMCHTVCYHGFKRGPARAVTGRPGPGSHFSKGPRVMFGLMKQWPSALAALSGSDSESPLNGSPTAGGATKHVARREDSSSHAAGHFTQARQDYVRLCASTIQQHWQGSSGNVPVNLNLVLKCSALTDLT
jgi:hypothetical protein